MFDRYKDLFHVDTRGAVPTVAVNPGVTATSALKAAVPAVSGAFRGQDGPAAPTRAAPVVELHPRNSKPHAGSPGNASSVSSATASSQPADPLACLTGEPEACSATLRGAFDVLTSSVLKVMKVRAL